MNNLLAEWEVLLKAHRELIAEYFSTIGAACSPEIVERVRTLLLAVTKDVNAIRDVMPELPAP